MASTIGNGSILIVPKLDKTAMGKVVDAIGENLRFAVESGLKNGTSAVKSQADEMGDEIEEAVEDAAEQGSGALQELLTQAFEAVVNTGTSLLGDITSGIFDLGASIGSIAAEGGLARAMNLEQAQVQFKALGLEWDDYYDTMYNAVLGTRYGLDEAAGAAALLAASGVSAGTDMEKALNGAVGVASVFGLELDDVAAIWQKVAAGNKLTGTYLTQLARNGIPALQTLADYLGITSEEVSELASAGEIDFETFSAAMYEAFGEAALESTNTFSGSLANIKNALSNLTQSNFFSELLAGLVPLNKAIYDSIMELNDWANASGFAQQIMSYIAPVIDNIREAFETFTQALEDGKSPLEALEAAFDSLEGPIGVIARALEDVIEIFGGLGIAAGALSGTITGLFGAGAATSLFGGLLSVSGISKAIKKGFSGIGTVITSAGKLAETAKSAWGDLKLAVSALGETDLANDVIAVFASISDGIKGFPAAMVNTVSGLGSKMLTAMNLDTFAAQVVTVFTSLQTRVVSIFTSLQTTIASIPGKILPVFSGLATKLAAVLAPVTSVLSGLFAPVLSVLGGLATTIKAALAPVVAFFAPIVQAFSGFLSTVLTPLTGGFNLLSVGIGAVLSPIGLLVGTVATIAGAVIYLSATSESFRETVGGVFEQVSTAVSSLWETFKTCFDQIKTVFFDQLAVAATALQPSIESVLSSIGTAITSVLGVVQAVLPVITTIVSTIITVAIPIFTAVAQVISGVLSLALQGLSAALDLVSNVIQTLAPMFQVVWDAILVAVTAAIGFLEPYVTGAIEGIRTTIETALTIIQTVFQAAWDAIQLIVTTVLGTVVALISGDTASISQMWSDLGSALSSLASSAWENVKQAFWDGVEQAVQFVKDMKDKVKQALSDAGTLLLDAGKQLIQGLIDGVTGAVSGAVSAVKNAVGSMVSGALSFLGINSPSKVFAEIGMGVMEGLAVGIDENAWRGVDAIEDAEADMVGAFALSAAGFENSFALNTQAGAYNSNSNTYAISLNGLEVKSDAELLGALQTITTRARMIAALG